MVDKIIHFTGLNAWKEGHKLILEVYTLVEKFPKKEQFGLTSQIERAAVSITSNIAEGFSRFYFKDKIRFYYMARGSVSEVQNLLIIAKDLQFIENKQSDVLIELCNGVQALINGLISSISKQSK